MELTPFKHKVLSILVNDRGGIVRVHDLMKKAFDPEKNPRAFRHPNTGGPMGGQRVLCAALYALHDLGLATYERPACRSRSEEMSINYKWRATNAGRKIINDTQMNSKTQERG